MPARAEEVGHSYDLGDAVVRPDAAERIEDGGRGYLHVSRPNDRNRRCRRCAATATATATGATSRAIPVVQYALVHAGHHVYVLVAGGALRSVIDEEYPHLLLSKSTRRRGRHLLCGDHPDNGGVDAVDVGVRAQEGIAFVRCRARRRRIRRGADVALVVREEAEVPLLVGPIIVFERGGGGGGRGGGYEREGTLKEGIEVVIRRSRARLLRATTRADADADESRAVPLPRRRRWRRHRRRKRGGECGRCQRRQGHCDDRDECDECKRCGGHHVPFIETQKGKGSLVVDFHFLYGGTGGRTQIFLGQTRWSYECRQLVVAGRSLDIVEPNPIHGQLLALV